MSLAVHARRMGPRLRRSPLMQEALKVKTVPNRSDQFRACARRCRQFGSRRPSRPAPPSTHGNRHYVRAQEGGDLALRAAVRDMMGVKGVTNNITVQPRVKIIDVREKIEAAFRRSAEIDARRVNVTAAGGKVILSGNVHSWAERQEAERPR